MTRKATIPSRTRAVLTALAAYALVLQTVLASLAGAAHAAEALQVEGIRCLQDRRTQPDHAPLSAHDGLCCTLSCHASGPAGPAPAFVLTGRPAPVALEATAPAVAQPARRSFSLLPVGSRAPPRLG